MTRIVVVSPECAPVSAYSGLSDYCRGLCRDALLRGLEMEVLMPFYPGWEPGSGWSGDGEEDLWAPLGDGYVHCRVHRGRVQGMRFRLIEPQDPAGLFRAGRTPDGAAERARFDFFARAAVRLLERGEWPDAVHFLGWETALGAVLWTATPRLFSFFEAPPEGGDALVPAVQAATWVSTSSAHYAGACARGAGGRRLAQALTARGEAFGGLRPALERPLWDPGHDPLVWRTFSANTLPRKADDKAWLRRQLHLEQTRVPLVVGVGRGIARKRIDLVARALAQALDAGAQCVYLGVAVEAGALAPLEALRGRPGFRLLERHDEGLAHGLFAAADILVHPARPEPRGLAILAALAYGAAPIVHRSGAGADLVTDVHDDEAPYARRNGFLFDTDEDLAGALERALYLWYEHPHHFRRLRVNAMATDCAWDRPGEILQRLYTAAP